MSQSAPELLSVVALLLASHLPCLFNSDSKRRVCGPGFLQWEAHF